MANENPNSSRERVTLVERALIPATSSFTSDAKAQILQQSFAFNRHRNSKAIALCCAVEIVDVP